MLGRDLLKKLSLFPVSVLQQKVLVSNMFATATYSHQALVYKEHGSPLKVVKLEQDPQQKLSDQSNVQVKMLAAAINPSDVNQLEGTYPRLPSKFPAVAGNEGVGKVVKIDGTSNNLKVGDLVIPAQSGFGTWRTDVFCEERHLLKVPSDLDISQLACLVINPCTAYRMLKDFTSLKEGDYVLQNGANSAVGRAVIQMAAAWKLRTINVVRDRPDLDQLKAELKSIGADMVITEQELKKGKEFLGIEASLALNCIGGKNATDLMRCLKEDGTMVTYGAMSKEPFAVPAGAAIFQNVVLRGFWLTRWFERHSLEERQEMIHDICDLIRKKKLFTPTKQFSLNAYEDALNEATKPFKNQKIIFSMQ